MANKRKKDNNINWNAIKRDYLKNNISLEDLAEKHKVTTYSIKVHCREEKWVQQKQDYQAEIDKKLTQKQLESEVERKNRVNQEHIEAYDDVLNLTKKILEVCTDTLERAKNKGRRASSIAYTIDKLATAIEKVQKGQRLALSIQEDEKENELPTINIIKGVDIRKI